MPHPLVDQYRFTRSEWLRGLVGISEEDAAQHYWYHTREIQAMRQMPGHKDLPEYVGDIEMEAPNRPE